MTPLPGQQSAIDTVVRRVLAGEATTTFVGPAGSGKTFCLRCIVASLQAHGLRVEGAAPSGKAARRATESSGIRFRTIHSFIYRRVREEEDEEGVVSPVFGAPAVVDPPDVLVVDEGSMVGTRLAYDIEVALRAGHDKPADLTVPRRTRLLVVGDAAQLPPVRDTWAYPLHAPDAALTDVVRQAADSPILRLATRVRTSADPSTWLRHDDPSDDRLKIVQGPHLGHVAAWIRERPLARTALSYTNATRQAVNHYTRQPWADEGPVTTRDRLVSLANQTVTTSTRGTDGDLHVASYVNGDVVAVRDVQPDRHATARLAQINGTAVARALLENPEGGPEPWVRLAPTSAGADRTGMMRFNGQQRPGMSTAAARTRRPAVDLFHFDYGSALTVHKSQGSQWPEVMVVVDAATQRLVHRTPDVAQRLLYTAYTRASERLIVLAL